MATGSFYLDLCLYSASARFVSISLCFGILLSRMGTLGKVGRGLSEDACRGLAGICRETGSEGHVCQSKCSLGSDP